VSYSRLDKTALKTILLQLYRRSSRLSFCVREDLTQKRARNAAHVAETVKRELVSAVERYDWRFAPRAKLSVSIWFSTERQRVPDLHKLVKFYLDPMHSIVFRDDRQVEHLTAYCWRPLDQFAVAKGKDDAVYIDIERLAGYRHRFDLYFSLMEIEEFRDYLQGSYEHRRLIESAWYEDNDIGDQDIVDLSDEAFDFLRLTQEAKEMHHRSALMRRQMRLLGFNRIEQFDRPGGPKNKELGRDFVKVTQLLPINISFGGLPEKGQKQQYRERIQHRIRQVRQRVPDLRSTLVPIGVDVQVAPRGLEVGKDLDNIMRDIIPFLHKELLDNEGYVQSYRIYVVDKLLDTDAAGSIRLKLMLPYAIGDLDRKMDDTLEAAKVWVKERLRNEYPGETRY